LPNPRSISLRISNDNNATESSWTHIFTSFGQFLAHDITEAASETLIATAAPSCPCNATNTACFSIPVIRERNKPADPLNTTCMEFVRSAPTFKALDCKDTSTREQLNFLSSVIDGSMIYGLSSSDSSALRDSAKPYLLKTSAGIKATRPYMPERKSTVCSGTKTHYCFSAGDGRESENLGLTGLHTVFMREHNRVAGELLKVGVA
jgi:peroxidase